MHARAAVVDVRRHLIQRLEKQSQRDMRNTRVFVAYQNVLSAGFRVVFDVERDEVLCELAVDGLVHLVEDEVE